MHELTITQNLLSLALQHAQLAGVRRITRINLSVGEISGIVDESVQFYFDLLSKDTPAEGAQIAFTKLPACFRCRKCGVEFPLRDGDWSCPACQATGGDVISGRQFFMDSIEVE